MHSVSGRSRMARVAFLIAMSLLAGARAEQPPTGALRLVYFTSPGCPDCRRVDGVLERLQRQYPELVVETRNLHALDALRYAEALADRFDVPPTQRLVAPAVYGAAGFLTRGAIESESLRALVTASAAMGEHDWWRVDADALASADASIGARYAAMGLGLVLAAGLLDGINPCAFATIIFLLSYLQVADRRPRALLLTGSAFILAIFLTYFLLGLGLAEVVSRLDALRYAGQVLTVAMALLALTIMGFSIRDGVLCLRGRMGEMTLQLPDAFKRQIRRTIRIGTRHSRVVPAAFVAGVAIAILELACTGQVYAPTILFMVRTGRGTAWTLGYLLLYNVAFVLPLIVVFGLACGGLRSETLTGVMKRHAAAVKFATAALFLGLAVLLLFGQRLAVLWVA